jgi:hypothetical protein
VRLLVVGFNLLAIALLRMEDTVVVLAALLEFLFRYVWVILKAMVQVIAWLMVKATIALGYEGLIDRLEKWWRRRARRRTTFEEPFTREEPRARQEQFSEQPRAPRPPPPDPYELALRLLGLGPDLTRVALKSAYRKAIVHAHPDNPAGTGSKQAAQAVNGAYDVIRARHGWPR